MKSKQGCHHGAASRHTRHPPQQEKYQQTVADMDRYVDEMVGASIESKELAIECVRKPGQRMPVGGTRGGHRPDHCLQVEPVLHVRILQYVTEVVSPDERVMSNGAVQHSGCNRQKRTDYENLPAGAKAVTDAARNAGILALLSNTRRSPARFLPRCFF